MRRLIALFLLLCGAAYGQGGMMPGPGTAHATVTFGASAILDDFNRANVGPPPSASWSVMFGGVIGGIKVVSNQLTGDTIANSYAGDSWNPATYGPNFEEYITVVTVPASTYCLALDAFSPATINTTTPAGYYMIACKVSGSNNDTIKLFHLAGGVGTQVGTTATVEFANGDGLGFKRTSASDFELFRKPSGGAWTSLGTKTDASSHVYVVLNFAVRMSATAVVLDDFGGGTL